jgi:hypothetical protein
MHTHGQTTAWGRDCSENESRWARGFWLELGAFFLKKTTETVQKPEAQRLEL